MLLCSCCGCRARRLLLRWFLLVQLLLLLPSLLLPQVHPLQQLQRQATPLPTTTTVITHSTAITSTIAVTAVNTGATSSSCCLVAPCALHRPPKGPPSQQLQCQHQGLAPRGSTHVQHGMVRGNTQQQRRQHCGKVDPGVLLELGVGADGGWGVPGRGLGEPAAEVTGVAVFRAATVREQQWQQPSLMYIRVWQQLLLGLLAT
jgi:hypothetical protein